MSDFISTFPEKIRHRLYQLSILLLMFFVAVIFCLSVSNANGMTHLSNVLPGNILSVLMLLGALLFICIFLCIGKLFAKLTDRQQMLFTIIASFGCVILQYWLLFQLRAVLRYDHLKVFDGALEILRTGNLSMTANNSYFGNYPFNISVTVFHSILLRLFRMLQISEGNYMLLLQCCYLFLIDLGILCSWKIVRLLHSVRTATLFALLCFFNPILYVCAAGCYTTTLMLPLLMASLLFIILLLKEKDYHKKILWGVLSGILLAFSAHLRVTVLIAAIGVVVYLIIRTPKEPAVVFSQKQLGMILLSITIAFTGIYGGFQAFKDSYVSEDYTDSQMPPLYYFMFAMNPETKGTYNIPDYEMISSLTTLEEKNEASLNVLKERLFSMESSEFVELVRHKLELTWGDGLEDYQDFITTSRNYSRLHSFLGEERGDFFALYGHIYHLATLALLFFALIPALRRKCDSPYYLIFITLLGGILFHVLWEAYYIYSFGFWMLIIIPATESMEYFSQTKRGHFYSGILGTLALAGITVLLLTNKSAIFETEFKREEKAVEQDMFTEELLPLLEGNTITQTFCTDRPFNIIGCKVFNETENANQSVYRIDLVSEDGTLIAGDDVFSQYVPNRDYCYLKLPLQEPEKLTNYTIVVHPIRTAASDYLTFAYYHSCNYDIYSGGSMTGLDSDEKTDLTFFARYSTTGTYND